MISTEYNSSLLRKKNLLFDLNVKIRPDSLRADGVDEGLKGERSARLNRSSRTTRSF